MNFGIPDGLKLSICTLALACSACTKPSMETTENDTAMKEKQQPAMAGMASTSPPAEQSMTEQISAAVADLASRTGVSEDSIKIIHARAVNWGSSAAGCPRKGMEYMQVIVPGVQLLLEADGTIYRYHGSRAGSLFYCPDDRAQAPAFGSGEEVM